MSYMQTILHWQTCDILAYEAEMSGNQLIDTAKYRLVVNLLLSIKHSNKPMLHYSRLLYMLDVLLVVEVHLMLSVKWPQQ